MSLTAVMLCCIVRTRLRRIPKRVYREGQKMRYKLLILTVALLCTSGFVQGASTFVTFSVDMSNQVANGIFIPGVNSVYVNGTFNGWGLPPNGLPLLLVQAGNSTVYTNTAN